MFRTFNHCIILWHNEHKEKGDLGDRKTELSGDSKNFFFDIQKSRYNNSQRKLEFYFYTLFFTIFLRV